MEHILSISSFFAGGIGAALVTGIFKLLELRTSNKTKDMADKLKASEELAAENGATIAALRSAMKVILHDRIKYLARSYIAAATVSYDDRRDLIEMHGIYHDGLGGNGNLDALMGEFMKVGVR